MNKEALSTDNAPKAIGPYSQAIRIGDFLFCSGQIPLDPGSMEIVGEGDVEAQAHQVFKNIAAVLENASLSFPKVVKTTVFLKDMGDFQKVNAIYSEYFPVEQTPPARSAVEVARLPKDVLVEIEVIAHY